MYFIPKNVYQNEMFAKINVHNSLLDTQFNVFWLIKTMLTCFVCKGGSRIYAVEGN